MFVEKVQHNKLKQTKLVKGIELRGSGSRGLDKIYQINAILVTFVAANS